MNLNVKGFAQVVEDMSAALQSSASNLVDVSVGSVIRAIFEANASVVLWLQWLILQVLQTTRASTSTGADLNSWMNDFGLERLPATASTGVATFSRFVASLPVSVPVGSLVKTGDGMLSFSVVADSTNSVWQSSSSAYLIPSGILSIDLPVMCTASGSGGNVLANTISVIAASLPGIDQVNNAGPLSNGMEAESDPAFRMRFQSYLASRSRATPSAVLNAVASVQQDLDVLVVENTGSAGLSQVGAFLVVIDDGSGFPPTSLLSSVATAVESVRPIGTTFAVVAPTVLNVNVSLTADFVSTAAVTLGIANIENQVAMYLNSLPIGKGASLTRVAQHAYLAGGGIENIASVQLNGAGLDIAPSPLTVIKAGGIVVTPQ